MTPRRITLARVLYLIGGALAAANGIIELGPDARTAVQAAGWPLIATGLAAFVLVWLLRKQRRWLPIAAAAVSLAMIAARIAQYVVLGTPFLLATGILPLLAAWSVFRGEWPGEPAVRKGFAVSAVVVTTAALVVAGGAGVVAAVLPCDLPAPAAKSGLVSAGGPSAPAKPTGAIPATDGVPLAYYAFVPEHPLASLVFYHGSGANSAAGYLGIGQTLEGQGIAVYLFDLRGHGASGGPRGDTPSTPQLQRDTESGVSFVHRVQPGVPEFVGGHSAGAGVVLNSASLIRSKVAGYAFLAPDFGLHSGTEAQDDAANFATICQRPLIAATVTNGLLGAHTQAVSFAYTAAQVRAGLIPRYTAAMAIAQNADDSPAILAGLDAPVGVWVGAQDEVFDPAKLVAYAKQHGGPKTTAATVPGASHLGVLDHSVLMGQWILANR